MIELIFVIVILGILTAVALPKFASTKRSAKIAAGRADIATIRSAIVSERQTQLVKGKYNYIPILSDNTTTLFTGTGTVPSGTSDDNRTLLLYGIKAGSASDGWSVNSTFLIYEYGINGVQTKFTYKPANGKFTCKRNKDDCNALVD